MISIILPSLNVVDYIDETITSVREQSLKDIEIICVDAGSNDGTREIIEKHADADDRIIVIDSTVRSYGYQVNTGIDRASGEYIAILETDDYVDKDMYGVLYDVASAESLDYVKCDYDAYTFDDKGDRVFSYRKISGEKSLYENSFCPKDNPRVSFEDWYLWNGIYRADFLKENGIRFSETKGAAFQDVGFLHKTNAAAQKVCFVDRSFYKYCVGRGDASSKSDRTICFIRDEYGFLDQAIDATTDERELILLYRRMAKSFARACMDCSDEMLEKPETKEICKWFNEKLSIAETKNYVSSDILPGGLRESYKHLVGTNDYLAYRKDREKNIKEFLGVDRPIIIFGCGVYGKEALAYLSELGYKIKCFMDNSDKLWGSVVEGVLVENPVGMKDMSSDTRYIVANENYAAEISKQIEGFAPKERILVF